MRFTVANHNTVSPKGFAHYDNVEFEDIPKMITSGYAYCACELKDEYRNDNNFLGGIDVLVIDVDDSCTIEQALVIFKEYKFYLITTKSHQIDKGGVVCDRFRIFIQLDKTVNDKKVFEDIYSNLISFFPFIDSSCRNVSRFYYSSPKSAKVIFSNGKLLEVSKMLKITAIAQRETPKDTSEVSEYQNSKNNADGQIYALNEITGLWTNKYGEVLENENDEDIKLRGILSFLDKEFYQGNKSNCLFQASSIMISDGFDENFIIDYLIKEWETRSSGKDKFRDALFNIKGAFKY